MKNKMAISIALGLVFGLSAIPARADMRAAELRVNGLSCPFCAFGIEKKLRRVSGVNELRFRVLRRRGSLCDGIGDNGVGDEIIRRLYRFRYLEDGFESSLIHSASTSVIFRQPGPGCRVSLGREPTEGARRRLPARPAR